jgi:glycosyltransferase involved in cell wall biosynthesis
MTLSLSLYTFAKDALYFDFHLVDMLKHHLPLADQIVVNEGYSTDGTYEAIKDLDPKIQVHRTEWDQSTPREWSIRFKNHARRLCTGEWCILIDCDEFIPEWDFDRIRHTLATTDKTILPLKYLHFYANNKVVNTRPEKLGWPVIKHAVHRNSPDIEAWGDGSNVGYNGHLDYGSPLVGSEPLATVHHFGFVRKASRLRHKWRIQTKRNRENRWDWVPTFAYDLLPHRWADPDLLDDLAVYDGPQVRAVRDNPSEFVRDNYALYTLLAKRDLPRHPAAVADIGSSAARK